MTDQKTKNDETLQQASGDKRKELSWVEQGPTDKGLKKLTVGYLDVIVIAVIVAVTTILIYSRYFAPKVVVVDLTGYIKEQRALFADGKIDKAEVSADLDRFQKFIQSQPGNVTVITKDVVLAGGREIKFPGVRLLAARPPAKNTEIK